MDREDKAFKLKQKLEKKKLKEQAVKRAPWPQVELRNLLKSKLFLVPEEIKALNSIPI